MDKDINSPINLCASVLEKLKIWKNESDWDLSLTQSDETSKSDLDVYIPTDDSINKSNTSLDMIGPIVASENLSDNRFPLEPVLPNGNVLKQINNTLYYETNNTFGGKFVNNINKEKPIKAFKFLKRGQGTAKYGSKKLIGFKKRNVYNSGKCIKFPQKVIHSKSLKNFEKLEELVEHSSFISTSSQINALLRDSICSTPISGKFNSLKNNCQAEFKIPTNRNILKVCKLGMPCDNEKPNSVMENSNLPSKYVDHTNFSDHKSSKVHFPEQGVEVVEYENESSAIALEDSDLVTFSDLEGLVDFNMKNLIQSIDMPSKSIKGVDSSESSMENILNNEPLNCADGETLKILMISKIQHLNKEIKAFKDKNDYLDNLTEELRQEKQNYVRKAEELKEEKQHLLEIGIEAQNKLKNCSCVLKEDKPTCTQFKNEDGDSKHTLISEQLHELLSSMKDIKLNMPKPKPFCNLKLISKNKDTVEAKPKYAAKEISKKVVPRPKSARTNINEPRHEIIASISPDNEAEAEYKASGYIPKNDILLKSQKTVNDDKLYPYNIQNNIDIKPVKEHCAQQENYFELQSKSTIEKKSDPISTNVAGDNFTPPLPFQPSDVRIFHHSSNYKQFQDKIVYYFPNQSTITKYNNGIEVKLFADGQQETYFPDGSYKISHVDDDITRTVRSDGSTYIESPGQREDYINGKAQHTYPDGTIKILYPNGTLETRYPNGRIRIKDRDGNILS